jgi:uncharacterized protein
MSSISQLEWKVNEMNSHEMKKAIMAMFEAFEKDFRNPEKILEQVAEDGEFWVAGNTPYSGTTTRGQKLKQLEGLKDVTDHGERLTATGWTIEGNRAAVEAVSYMKMKNGKEYRNEYHFLFEFRGNKITKVKEYMDTAYMLDTLCRP